jgi:ASC-1-like (ASCH) protein
MKVCVCRNISDKDHDTYEKLLKRLQQEDSQCKTCIKEELLQYYKKLYLKEEMNK